ncbi:MAG: response regulator [Phycisphaerae bacterium]|jgi:two-component system chemotaxis response regulator CheY|nr:response regulator [Phycisphaerae bacterium]
MALNILVVDDSSVTRKMIIKALGLSDLPLGEVFEAASGFEGLTVLYEHWVDLILADLNMPEMNGEEMIERIRKNPALADIPIVVVSTEGSKTRIERLEEMGVRFIHKPFPPEQIQSVVSDILGLQNETSNV